jgi:hypothetical protein
VNFRRLRSGLGLVAFIVVASAGAGLAQVSPNAPPPPPLPNSTLPPSSVLTTPQPATAPLAPTSTFAPVATAAPTVPAGPTASPSPGPKRGHKAAPKGTPEPEASETPEPPQFSSLSGIWELEIQPLGHRLATYEHFSLTQSGNQLIGYWEHDPHKTRNAVSGTFDGHVFQINTQTPDGTAVSFAGYVENMADMVGVRHIGPKDSGTAFTGQHRKKEGAKV